MGSKSRNIITLDGETIEDFTYRTTAEWAGNVKRIMQKYPREKWDNMTVTSHWGDQAGTVAEGDFSGEVAVMEMWEKQTKAKAPKAHA